MFCNTTTYFVYSRVHVKPPAMFFIIHYALVEEKNTFFISFSALSYQNVLKRIWQIVKGYVGGIK